MKHLAHLWHTERIKELRYILHCVQAECSEKHKVIRIRTIRRIESDIATEFEQLKIVCFEQRGGMKWQSG